MGLFKPASRDVARIALLRAEAILRAGPLENCSLDLDKIVEFRCPESLSQALRYLKTIKKRVRKDGSFAFRWASPQG
jgi:hypothetical protein